MSKYQVIKGQNVVQDKINSNERFTPLPIIEKVQKFYKDIEFLDVASCAIAQKYIKASAYFSKENNALNQNWSLPAIWMNPPYSFPEVEQFANKLLTERYHGHFIEAIALVNANTETKWFQGLAMNCDIRIDLSTRQSFWHPQRKCGRNPKGQSLFYFGSDKSIFYYGYDREPEFLEIFGDLGLAYGRPIN